MQHLLPILHELDSLYHPNTLAEYETKWQIVAQQVEQDFPGFTIAYAELSNSGVSRLSDAAMRHVIVPQQP